jgi:hypothetical protein
MFHLHPDNAQEPSGITVAQKHPVSLLLAARLFGLLPTLNMEDVRSSKKMQEFWPDVIAS